MINEKLSKAKAALILDNPFFASILLSMPFVESKEIQTFATDGETIKINPEFLETLTVAEITFVLAHETLHCIFEHMMRVGEKDAENWNIATDYIINDLLTKEQGVGTMPAMGLLNPKLVADGGYTAEGVYNLLPVKPKAPKGTPKPKQGTGPRPLDELIQPSQDEAVLAEKSASMKVKVAQARNAAKMRGSLSSGLDRLLDDCLHSETPWKDVLRNFISQKAKIDLSYAKPNRRFLGEDVPFPSLIGEKLGPVLIAVDCSGSISPALLGDFESEIKAIIQDVSPSQIEIFYFDASVVKTESYSRETFDSMKLKPVGGGGTAFSPIFEKALELEIQPVACVVLTDLCCDDFGPVPDFPVLWASTERRPDVKRALPFGETIYLNRERV